jgi:ribosomal-protein-alanine acetyltransferase
MESKQFVLEDGTSIQIRRMVTEDAESVSVLEKEAFSMPWSKEAFISTIQSKDAFYVVAELDGEIVGCCGVINACGDGDISNVSVKESLRGKGIGKAMVSTLLTWAESIGIENYTLEVRAGNERAIRLYESLGFVGEGIRPGFYDKPKEDALIMWKRQQV